PGELSLSQQFQVSRNCIREVLKALSLAHIVEAHRGNGTFITEDAISNINSPLLGASVMGAKSLWELKDVRDLLEGHVAFLAARHASQEQVEQLKKSLEAVPGENITEGHAGFHRMLAEIANNKLLTRILSSVQEEMDQLRVKYGKLPKAVLDTYTAEHEEIYRMVRDHQPEKAREAMQRHIDAAWTDTLYEGLMDRQ
ncbi:MAG: FadR family transcriptional regulator, partial [Fretibacterium sp.]|nr:FadR family transcriptional regulator [Fretibacterium sp.]